MARRPKPIRHGRFRARVVRGPHRERGNAWYWRVETFHEGSDVCCWTGWATRAEMLDAVLPVAAVPEPRREAAGGGEVVTVHHLLRAWWTVTCERADLATKSHEGYRNALRRLRSDGALKDTRIDRMSADVVRGYRDRRVRGGAAATTTNQDVGVLASAWSWGIDVGIVSPPRPFPKLPKLKASPAYNDRTPTRAEVEMVIGELAGWHQIALRLIYATGARPSEVLDLTRERVDLEAECVTLGSDRVNERGKTGARVVPVSRKYLQALDEHLTGPGPLTTASPNALNLAVSKACERAGVPRFTPKGVRKLVEDILYQHHMDPSAAAAILGHSPTTAMLYYRRPSKMDLRRALQEVHLGEVGAGEVVEFPTGKGR